MMIAESLLYLVAPNFISVAVSFRFGNFFIYIQSYLTPTFELVSICGLPCDRVYLRQRFALFCFHVSLRDVKNACFL
jgi:hypothetical protein